MKHRDEIALRILCALIQSDRNITIKSGEEGAASWAKIAFDFADALMKGSK